MTRPRWMLSDLLLLVLATGIALACYRLFWKPPPDPNARPYLSAFLVLLATASLGSVFGRPALRRPFRGFALYGWCNLVFILHGGFVLKTVYDARRIVEGSQMGVVFGVLSAILAAWLLEPPGANRDQA